MIATDSEPGVSLLGYQAVFLYLGAADATVKPEFLRNLRGPAVTHFPTHRTVRLDYKDLLSSVCSCSDDGFERVVVIGDLDADGENRTLDVIIRGFSGRQRALGKLGCVEFFLALKPESDFQHVVSRLVPLAREFSTAPYLKFYALTTTRSAESARSEMTGLLIAITASAPSRMELIGEGVSGFRNRAESSVSIAHYHQTSLPLIKQVAVTAVNESLWEETFSFRPERDQMPQILPGVEQLLNASNVGVEEPPVTSIDFVLRRSFYRDALLHPIACRLLSSFPDEPTFLEGVEHLADQLRVRSEGASSLFSDFRNALISARGTNPGSIEMCESCFGAETKATIRGLVRPLARQFRFPLWPLLRRQIRPSQTATGVRGLYEQYERLLREAVDTIRESLEKKLRLQQEATKHLMHQKAARGPCRWKLPANSFMFVHQDVSTDRTDEIWPYEDRCGFLGLLQTESCP